MRRWQRPRLDLHRQSHDDGAADHGHHPRTPGTARDVISLCSVKLTM
jgi:hypothetical protein